METRPSIKDLSPDALRALFAELNLPRFRAGQVLEWLYANHASSFDRMTNLPQALRESLSERFSVDTLEIADRQESEDGSTKTLYQLGDGHRIEAVLLPDEKGRRTLCLSSQVGCGMGCTFCRTASMGLKRGLTAAEIVDQAIFEIRTQKLDHILFMGMGEALDNVDNLRVALSLMTDRDALAFSPTRITVSTAGMMQRAEEIGMEFPGVNIAVSLNHPEDESREKLMPLSRKVSATEVFKSLNGPMKRIKGRLTVEYVLIGGINDSPELADTLALRLKPDKKTRINLIRYNEAGIEGFGPPDEHRLYEFQRRLIDAGHMAFIRKPLGREISGACGQLAADDIDD